MKLMNNLQSCSYINFNKAINDGLIKLQRDSLNKAEPVITLITLDSKKSTIVQFGQHNSQG